MVESGCGCWGLCWFPEGHSLAWGVGIAFAHGSRMEHFVLRNGARAELQLLPLKRIKYGGFFFCFNR